MIMIRSYNLLKEETLIIILVKQVMNLFSSIFLYEIILFRAQFNIV